VRTDHCALHVSERRREGKEEEEEAWWRRSSRGGGRPREKKKKKRADERRSREEERDNKAGEKNCGARARGFKRWEEVTRSSECVATPRAAEQ